MFSRRVLVRALGLTLACGLRMAITAHAADATSFARQIAASYHVDPRRVVAADIDRDGDLDVLAATDDGFRVWVNDGSGRFTSQTPASGPLADGRPAETSWNGAESQDRETIQSESTPVVPTSAPAHPDTASRSTSAFDAVARRSSVLGSRAPRAPPLA